MAWAAVGKQIMSCVGTPGIEIVGVLVLLVAPWATIGQAEAACSPNSPVNNATVTCTGITNGQNGTAGYGTNTDTGNTITVQAGASVAGASIGLLYQTGTVNNFGTVTGTASDGIGADITTVTNSGTISGGTYGISASGLTVTNSGGVISGGTAGLLIGSGAHDVTNSGTISGGVSGIDAGFAVTVGNAGTITGVTNGIVFTTTGNVTNSAIATISATGPGGIAINGTGNAVLTLTNFGVISATGAGGIGVSSGTANVTNSGSIAGVGDGIGADFADVTNSGTISGGAGANGIVASSVTLINSGNVSGGSTGVLIGSGAHDVTNSGTISGGVSGIDAGFGVTVGNTGAITGGTNGIVFTTTGNVTNSAIATISATGPGGIAVNGTGNAVLTLTNFGIISATGAGSSGVISGTANVTNSGSIAAVGDGIGADFANVTNSGTISGGAGANGIAASSVTLNNSGNVSGGSRGVLAATASINNSGSIVGGVGIDAGSASAITNSGTITGLGGTAILFGSPGNTLTLGPGSVINGTAHGFGADTFQLGGTGTDTFNASLFATQYLGYTTFNKIGSSIWTLTGTNATAMPWTVSAGTLIVNGTLANSTMTVNAGATLGGSGTVGNTAIVGGTLAPGNIGPLTVQGNLSLTAASTYMIQISPANAGRTNVTGVATLGGATVNAAFLPGSPFNKQYTILTATGGVSGTFNPTVVFNMPNLQPTLSYDANDVFLNLKLSFVSPSGGLNINQQNVANALTNFFNATGSIPAAFTTLNAAGLTIASGELGTGVIQSSIKADDLFLNLLLDPTIAGRAGGFAAPGGGASQFAADDETSAYAAKRRASPGEREAYAMATKAPTMVRPAGQPAGASGARPMAAPRPSAAMPWWARRTPGRASGVSRWVPTTRSRPTPCSALHWRAGPPASPLPMGLAAVRRICSRPAPMPGTISARPMSRPRWAMAGTTSPPTAPWRWPVSTCCRAASGPTPSRAGSRAAIAFATPSIGITPYAAVQAVSFNLPAYAEQTLAGTGRSR